MFVELWLLLLGERFFLEGRFFFDRWMFFFFRFWGVLFGILVRVRVMGYMLLIIGIIFDVGVGGVWIKGRRVSVSR